MQIAFEWATTTNHRHHHSGHLLTICTDSQSLLTLLLKAYANLFDTSADPRGPLCEEEPQRIEHCVRRCPRLDSTAKTKSFDQCLMQFFKDDDG